MVPIVCAAAAGVRPYAYNVDLLSAFYKIVVHFLCPSASPSAFASASASASATASFSASGFA